MGPYRINMLRVCSSHSLVKATRTVLVDNLLVGREPSTQKVRICLCVFISLHRLGELSDCECLQGWFQSADGRSCLTCPYGSTTEQAGLKNLDAYRGL